MPNSPDDDSTEVTRDEGTTQPPDDAEVIALALRPRKRNVLELDPAVSRIILAVVRVGAGTGAAATQAGVHRETLRLWERSGRTALARAHAGEELNERDRTLAAFALDLEKARAHPRTYLLGLVTKAARGDWRAGAWLLERLYPGEFGPDVRVRVSDDRPPPVDLSRLTAEELLLLRSIRAKLNPPRDVIDVKAHEGDDDPDLVSG